MDVITRFRVSASLVFRLSWFLALILFAGTAEQVKAAEDLNIILNRHKPPPPFVETSKQLEGLEGDVLSIRDSAGKRPFLIKQINMRRNLRELTLTGKEFDDDFLRRLKLPELQVLVLDATSADGSGLDKPGQIPKLEQIGFMNCQVSAISLKPFDTFR